MSARTTSSPGPADALLWEWMLTELQREREHRRRMDWVHTGLQAFGSLLGAGTVVAYICVATYFLAHDAATQGAAILGGGTAALVGGFLGKRYGDRR
ncbi:hypothetical protein ACWDWU_25175 [Streptomyces sp. NPDC003442]